jgi:hypothetical protein
LIEIATEEIKHIWSRQEVHISGLRPNISYDLSLWNLLKPEEKEILVNIDKSSSSFQCDELENIITVSLANIDTLGIFLVQLKLSANSSSQVIGWWSNIWDNRNTIFPDELDNNYCFNILGNEDLDDFHDLADKIHFDDEHIRKGISSLQSNEGYLADWIDQDLLLKKIQSILPSNIYSVTTSPESSISKPQNLIYSLDIKKNTPTIRKAFCKRFSDQLMKSGFGQSIQLIKDPVLRDLLRVQIEDQQYLPRLKAILTDLESALHTSIRLEKWR